MNCLTYCLEQWSDNPDFRLWYNSNHVVVIEPHIDLRDKGYLPLEEYGFNYFTSSFSLSTAYSLLLQDYFDQL
jgi:hypothetical protein